MRLRAAVVFLRLWFLLLTLLPVACAPRMAVQPAALRFPPLRDLSEMRGTKIGAAVAIEPLRTEILYSMTLSREFNMLTPENAMKFRSLHPEPFRYDFSTADEIVAAAELHNMQVRGHSLVWHRQLPPWLTENAWTRKELIKILRKHIKAVVGHYRGRIVAWDVVNEAVAEDGSLRDTFWLRGIGPDYIEMAFRWAHEADPKAMLFYNDYGGEGTGSKSDAIYTLVSRLVQRGVPIHGLGLQMHVSTDRNPSPKEIAANMARMDRLGLEVHITELDVRLKAPATKGKPATQAEV